MQQVTTEPTAKRLLMVAPHSLYFGWGGQLPRILDIVSGLNGLGWSTTLLTTVVGPSPLAQDSAANFPGRVLAPDRRTLWFNPLGASKALASVLRPSRRRDDPEFGWGAMVARWYLRAAPESVPSVIWGISIGDLVGAVAAREIARGLGRPWVHELQDPCRSLYPDAVPNQFEERSLARCIETCAAVVTTTQSLADHLAEQQPVCAQKVYAVHLCYDDRIPLPERPRPANGVIKMLHAGALYGERTALPLVRAIAQAFRACPSFRERVRLVLLGGGLGGEQAVQLAAELGIAHAVECPAPVPANQAVAAMDEADVLVLIKFPGAAYDMQVPGKTYQYIGRGKPILGIMRPRCEAADIVRRSGIGVVVTPDDIDGLADTLQRLWADLPHLGRNLSPNWDYISGFSLSAMARRLDALLSGLAPTCP